MYEDYDDYKEAINCIDLVVFGSVKHIPLCEILGANYDTSTCPVTNNVFNPTKRVNWKSLHSIIDRLKEKVVNYTGTDRAAINKDIELLEESSDKNLNFYNWTNQFGKIFNNLCDKLDLKIANRTINYNNMKEEWSYEKNMAFWAGAIEKRKPLVLCSPYFMYENVSNTTIHEMLWLHDNGYTFEPMMTGATTSNSDYMNQIKVIAIPPSFPLEEETKVKIIDYRNEKSWQVLTSFNNKIVNPLNTKVYSSNTELNLSETNKQYQDMYNAFVHKFNLYFGEFHKEHQDLEQGTSVTQNITLQSTDLPSRFAAVAAALASAAIAAASSSPAPQVPASPPMKSDESREALEPSPKYPKPKPGARS